MSEDDEQIRRLARKDPHSPILMRRKKAEAETLIAVFGEKILTNGQMKPDLVAAYRWQDPEEKHQ